ncbi:unnamed protein product [Orchesella dallaii]|uniref:Uncharacterized protein n=1 Tax=Orchesella dallaii TaxID=48710 RepID=A0ABP1RHQ1_9HEXA
MKFFVGILFMVALAVTRVFSAFDMIAAMERCVDGLTKYEGTVNYTMDNNKIRYNRCSKFVEVDDFCWSVCILEAADKIFCLGRRDLPSEKSQKCYLIAVAPRYTYSVTTAVADHVQFHHQQLLEKLQKLFMIMRINALQIVAAMKVTDA